MSLVRCPNGHMFSVRRHGTICPYCNMETKPKDKLERPPKDFDVEMELMEDEIEPVCGWIVCVEGARQGKDYKIKSGKNFIGRGDDMDIQILGDNGIARKNHAIIVYDPKKRNTVLLPGDSSGLTYFNDEAVYVPTDLAPYSVIEMGKSKFVFLPFCGEHFEWNEG
ncbi:hypothetical protein FACS189418_7680 [Clostridia bacterium]|nr:hypothetical protein FACS189418_7680 [Clostridia bacterium]